MAQYRVGATDFNRVSNLQLALVDAQNLLALTKGEVAQSLIAVYKAIGGGWRIRLGSAAPQAPFEILQPGPPLEEMPEAPVEEQFPAPAEQPAEQPVDDPASPPAA